MVPFEFETLWTLRHDGPLTASEIAAIKSTPIHAPDISGRWVSNQLRRLVAAGLVEGEGGRRQIYRLTERGREYVDA